VPRWMKLSFSYIYNVISTRKKHKTVIFFTTRHISALQFPILAILSYTRILEHIIPVFSIDFSQPLRYSLYYHQTCTTLCNFRAYTHPYVYPCDISKFN